MTAKILEFKGPTGKPHHRENDFRLRIPDTTIFSDTQEDVLGRWRTAALRDELDAHFHESLPKNLRKKRQKNYLDDLDHLAWIEQQLQMAVMVFSPGTTTSNQHGWISYFRHNKYNFSTPEMINEGTARGVNILCFIAFVEEKNKRS
jgi:hypothetical protein